VLREAAAGLKYRLDGSIVTIDAYTE